MKAIYPGSFDPVTNGHLDIIERAINIFEEIIVTVSHNVAKSCLFSTDERVNMIIEVTKQWPSVRVVSSSDLTADFAKSQGAGIIIRGLRAVSDFDIEFKTALMNKHLNPDLDTVFLMTRAKYLYLNSSIIREIASFGGKVEDFVPTHVVKCLKRKYNTV